MFRGALLKLMTTACLRNVTGSFCFPTLIACQPLEILLGPEYGTELPTGAQGARIFDAIQRLLHAGEDPTDPWVFDVDASEGLGALMAYAHPTITRARGPRGSWLVHR